jgi:hypothetical protein
MEPEEAESISNEGRVKAMDDFQEALSLAKAFGINKVRYCAKSGH